MSSKGEVMAERVIAIEVGSKITKVCETDYKASPALYQYFTFETPEGVVDNQIATESEAFRDALQQQLKSHGVKAKRAVFVLSTIGIGTKEETIPAMKEKSIQDYVNTNIATFFPVNPEECRISYRINGKTEDGKYRIQLFVVHNDLLQSYMQLATFCGLDFVDLEFSENGIAQTLRKTFTEGNVVNVNVEDEYTAITIVKDGDIALQRSVS